MRCISLILVYALLFPPTAQAGLLSRGERLRRAYLGGRPSVDTPKPAVHGRQEVDDGITPTPIFSTIIPDDPDSASTPPLASSAIGDDEDTYKEDGRPLTTTTTTDAAETGIETPIPSSEQAFLPPISSRVSVPPSLRPSQTATGPSQPTEESSAAPEVATSHTTDIINSQTSEPPSESTDAYGAPGGNEGDSGDNVTPTPIFSTTSAGPTAFSSSSDEQLSLASSLQLPVGEGSTTLPAPETPSSAQPVLPSSSVVEGPSTSVAPAEPPFSSVLRPTEAQSSAPAASESTTVQVESSTRPITDGPVYTTTRGLSPSSGPSSADESGISSAAEELSRPIASSVLPVETSTLTPTTTVAEITPTGEPDAQVPTNRGPPNPSATSSVSPERFQANLEQARAFHESFKSLTEQSACFGEQAACINGGIARCQTDKGHFIIQACDDPAKQCFPLPLVFEDGAQLACSDPAEALRILGIEDEDAPQKSSTTTSADQVVTVTETPAVTKIVTTETLDNGSAPQSPSSAPPAEGVVTVTETPTVTKVIATETVENPGPESTAPPLESTGSASGPEEAYTTATTTTIVRGPTLTLTTFITVQPPPPEPTEPVTTQFITVIITALPSVPPRTPSEVADTPEPTASAQPEDSNGGGSNTGDGGDDHDGSEDGDDPILTSLNVIIIPTTLLTTTIRATPPGAGQALATPVDDTVPTVTTTITEIVSVPVLVTVTQREVRIEQATITATVTQMT